MPLAKYHSKRDFAKSPEPRGGKTADGQAPVFVVQKHDASRLHYDLRLEIDGVLASWAVPKGPSTDPSHKRLAVHVEDHPIEYATFEGVIPSGYGAGTVMLWDRGTWSTDEKEPAKAVRKGKLSFSLDGQKLRGGWTLARMGGKGNEKNWLLIKHDDNAAGRDGGILQASPRSVASGRTLEQIADSSRNGDARFAMKPGVVEGAKKARLPPALKPQLCTLVDEAPDGDEWLHEIKYDGYRLIARKRNGSATLTTRGGKDWTDRFTPIAGAIEKLDASSLVLDGEACIVDAKGHTSFQGLQQAIKARRFGNLAFFAFDLVHLDGYSLLDVPLEERKRLLKGVLGTPAPPPLQHSEYALGDGPEVHARACDMGLEGIISKRLDSRYTQARSRAWVKVKCAKRQEFVVIGFTPPSGSRKHLGALLLGVHDEGGLRYAGKVGTGFTTATLRELRSKLAGLVREDAPARNAPSRDTRHATWVEPVLVAEVRFAQWTEDGRLRHAAFEGLREDKTADEVSIESPKHMKVMNKPRPVKRTSTHKAEPRNADSNKNISSIVAGVNITHPDRVLFPDAGLTKLDLARYYESVAEFMLPLIARRPLSTVRCPKGRAGKCFYQKHMGDTFAEPVLPMRVAETSGEADYISIDSTEGLVTLAQFGVLEIHPWGCQPGDPETPDRITWDLDPGPGVEWSDIVQAARRVKAAAEELGLVPYLLASGGKGLHVTAPLKGQNSWDHAKAVAKVIADHLAAKYPEAYVANVRKAKREGRVYIDYLRNGRGATSVAPYSVRARPGAPVATPIRWDEASRLSGAGQYDPAGLTRRLGRLKGDPWEGFEDARRPLPSLPEG